MTKTVEIPPVGISLYERAPDERVKDMLDGIIDSLQQAANWKVRKKILTDLLALFERIIAMPALPTGDDEAASGEAGGPSPDDSVERAKRLVTMTPMIMGSVLEKLGETRIHCIEQAAFYLLSGHPEHQKAARDWVDSDYRHSREMKKFIKANPSYRNMFELGISLAPAGSEP